MPGNNHDDPDGSRAPDPRGGIPYDEVELYFDGTSRGNPGPAAAGWVVTAPSSHPTQPIIDERSLPLGETTNNVAEYHALRGGLVHIQCTDIRKVSAHGDSELIVRQVNGEYDTDDPMLRHLRDQVRRLLAGFEQTELGTIPRDKNGRADSVAENAIYRQ